MPVHRDTAADTARSQTITPQNAIVSDVTGLCEMASNRSGPLVQRRLWKARPAPQRGCALEPPSTRLALYLLAGLSSSEDCDGLARGLFSRGRWEDAWDGKTDRQKTNKRSQMVRRDTQVNILLCCVLRPCVCGCVLWLCVVVVCL